MNWSSTVVKILKKAFGTGFSPERDTAFELARQICERNGTRLAAAYADLAKTAPGDHAYLEEKRMLAGIALQDVFEAPKTKGEERRREEGNPSEERERGGPGEGGRRAKGEEREADGQDGDERQPGGSGHDYHHTGKKSDDEAGSGSRSSKRGGRKSARSDSRSFDDFHEREKRLHAACAHLKRRVPRQSRTDMHERFWFDGYYELEGWTGRGPIPDAVARAVASAYAMPASFEEALVERQFWINAEADLRSRHRRSARILVDPVVLARRQLVDREIMFGPRARTRGQILSRISVGMAAGKFDARHFLSVISTDLASL